MRGKGNNTMARTDRVARMLRQVISENIDPYGALFHPYTPRTQGALIQR